MKANHIGTDQYVQYVRVINHIGTPTKKNVSLVLLSMLIRRFGIVQIRNVLLVMQVIMLNHIGMVQNALHVMRRIYLRQCGVLLKINVFPV